MSWIFWLYATAIFSYSKSKFSCEGPHINIITNVIMRVTWKTLADEVGIREVDIYTISGNCKLDENPFHCYRREMIQTLCSYKTVNELQGLPCEIAAALDRIGKKNEADILRKHFPTVNCAADETKLEGASVNSIEPSSVNSVRDDLDSLNEQFDKLRRDVLIFLGRAGIIAKDLCYILSDQPYWKRNHHFSHFLLETANALANAENIMAIFIILNTHWDFMNSDILGHITSYYHHNSAVKDVNKNEAERLHTEYNIYESRLKHFLQFTTVQMFCEVEACDTDTEIPPHLLEIISKHSWYPPVYLEKVDKFRRSLADYRNTPTFAAMIVGLNTGSVIIRLFVANTSLNICTSACVESFEENDIVELTIQGSLIYRRFSDTDFVSATVVLMLYYILFLLSWTAGFSHVYSARKDSASAAVLYSPVPPLTPLSSPVPRLDHEESGYELFEKKCTIQVNCPICCEVVHKPYLIPCCGHNFCHNCLMKLPVHKVAVAKEVEKEEEEEHEENEEGAFDHPAAKKSQQPILEKVAQNKCQLCHANYKDLRDCPMCRKIFCENCIKRNVGLSNDLKKIEVRCRYHSKGCKWIGYHQNTEDHEKMQCLFVPNPESTEERSMIIPITRTLQKVSERKEQKLKPFYTHNGGYKMQLWVFPNGYGSSEGNYLSVFTCLVKGENDERLEWPLCCSITVQLLDHSGNDNHLEHTIDYDKHCDLTYCTVNLSGRSEGLGIKQFLAHKLLFDECCVYVKNDCLKLRISKCKINQSWLQKAAFIIIIVVSTVLIFSYMYYV